MDYTNIKPEIKGKQLTNGQLIELLQTLPKEALVWHEGCDCLGEADRVEFCKEKNEILIGRCNVPQLNAVGDLEHEFINLQQT